VFLACFIAFNLSFILAYPVSNFIYLFINHPLIVSHGYFTGYWNWDLILFSNFVFLFGLHLAGLLGHRRSLFNAEDSYRLLKVVVLTYLLTTFAIFTAKGVNYSRVVVSATFVLALLTANLSMLLVSMVLGFLRRNGFDRKRILIVGKNESSERMLEKLAGKPELGYDFLGFVDDKEGCVAKLSGLEKAIRELKVDTVFVALPAGESQWITEFIMEHDNVEFKLVPELMLLIAEPPVLDEISDTPLVSVKESSSFAGYLKVKRLLDIAISLAMLVVLSPLLVLVSLLIKLESSGPVLYKHTRIGLNGREFTLLKFRTMREGAEKLRPKLVEAHGVRGLFKLEKDPRVTVFGYFLRRTCLDELPQLVNILKGEMSLVGPRPYIPEESVLFKGWMRKRFEVKPGLTGLWQVGGRHEIDFEKTAELDLYYIKHMSLLLDLEILLKTIPSIILSKGRW
ncbi:MAG: sugar transferase, partial [Candidatus Altiarchaeales archaeon]|nr:sugar transferase [Candidatus Altiarchaeales archaeon]